MSQFFSIHPLDPQPRLVHRTVDILRTGGVVVYPTDSCYALGCLVGDKTAMERIRAIRAAGRDHNFTLVCRDLAEIASYARVDNPTFRLLKACTPGPYTFILRATHGVSRRLQHPKRKTIGIRVPAHRVPQAILAELREPLMSSTLIMPGEDTPLTDPEEDARASAALGGIGRRWRSLRIRTYYNSGSVRRQAGAGAHRSG